MLKYQLIPVKDYFFSLGSSGSLPTASRCFFHLALARSEGFRGVIDLRGVLYTVGSPIELPVGIVLTSIESCSCSVIRANRLNGIFFFLVPFGIQRR